MVSVDTEIVCVGAMIFRDDCVLLGLRAPHRSYANCWDIVGGHCEDGESSEAALIRELREEIGIVPIAFERCAEIMFADAGCAARLEIFMVSAWNGTPALRNDEHTDLRWHRIPDACKLTNLALKDYAGLFVSLRPIRK